MDLKIGELFLSLEGHGFGNELGLFCGWKACLGEINQVYHKQTWPLYCTQNEGVNFEDKVLDNKYQTLILVGCE